MNRNANTIFGFVAAAVLILSGCINNVDTETGGNSNVPDGKCSLTVDSGFSARAAFPSSLAADMVYAAEISYSSSGAKKWLGADFLENSPAVLRNSPSASGEIRFVFCAPEESAEYTITVFACPAGTSVGSAADVENVAAASGQAEFSLKAGQKALETPVKVSLSLVTNKTVSGKGKVDLPISLDSVLGIVAAEVNVTKDGVSDSGENNYGFKIEVSGNSATLSAESAPAGTYLAIMKFYNSTTDFSSSTEVAVNSAVQQVSVYPGMTTDCWFIDGKKHGTTEADGTFTRSALELTKYDFTELYVCGTDGGGESDGKRSFYVSSNFASSVLNAIDTDGDGSMAKPFATVQKAVDTIAASVDTTKKYTIYVDGTVEPTYADTALSDGTFIFIKGTTPSNLNLTIKGLSAVSKAVLNAKQNTGNGGRVLTSKNTSLTLENLKITGGKVKDCGGIHIISGNLTLKNCVVTKNESSNCGGGIHFDGENLIVEGSEISGNKGDPGGICVAEGSAKTKIKDSNIIKNSARSGGGLDLAGESTIEDCNITDNKAESSTGGGGGLILASNNKSCIIKKSVISKNIAGESGGGIYINGGTLSLERGAAINSNKAKNGGGIYIRDGSLNLESGAAISNNTAKKDGGAIYASCEYSTITVNIGEKDDSDDIVIEKNNAERGGAFYGANNARFVMNAGKVSENYSTITDEGGGGGAMFLWGGTSNYSTFTMNGGEIIGNMAKDGGAGGAVHIDDGSGKNAAFIMTGGLLSGNKAADENGTGSKLGGAIYVKKGGKIKLGGSAVIAVSDESDSCNDIYLGNNQTITITGTLAPENNAAARNPKYTARITPQTYTVGTTIIQGEPELDSNSCSKFLVTANGTDELKYKIKYDSSSKTGKLATTQNIVINGNEYDKTALEDVIDTATTITGGGSEVVFIDNRTVTLSPYSIGKYEVTQELFEAVMGENPSSYSSSPEDGEEQKYRPVEQVNCYHAIVFCNKLSKKLGLEKCYTITSGGSEIDIDNFDCKAITAAYSGWTVSCDLTKNGYRLPTAAEWEFAARGGNQNAAEWNYTYAGSNNVGDVAWYNDDGNRATKKTHQVGLKKANSLDLYDMSGNVWEICWDFSSLSKGTVTDPYGESGSEYYRLGGGFGEKEADQGSNLSVTKRTTLSINDKTLYGDVGFRLARSGFPREN